jgi:Ca2+:H+ antiporter
MILRTLRSELGLAAGVVTTLLVMTIGRTWLADLGDPLRSLVLFAWIFAVMLWLSFSVVRHADALAIKLGEPYGTLILTLSVISIEVIMVSAVMLTGAENPALGRDMMFSVVMIVMNGLVGLSLLLGGRRHWEQRYNLQGANTFLAVLIPLAVLGLVLPNYTRSTSDGTFSVPQTIFLVVMTLGLYGAFLALQTVSHKDYFRAPPQDEPAIAGGHEDHHGIEVHSVSFHSVLLVACMLPIVLLSKSMAKLVDHGITVAGAPIALGGFLVAVLVLSPEGMAAVQAALNNKLQRSINVCLGSALATIGLTVPAVLCIGLATGKAVVLGLESAETVLLLLTLAVSMVNFSSGRSNVIQGVIHLILFATYLVLIFD